MGALVRTSDGLRLVLPARAVFGRGPDSTVILEEPLASSQHARISWTGSAWEVRDLGSRNGTYVNGACLTSGAPMLLTQGDRLSFGTVDVGFVLEDASAPGPMAFDLHARVRVQGVGDLLQLPTPSSPEATVYHAAAGTWRIEDTSGDSDIADGAIVQVGGSAFRIELPEASDRTPIADLSFALHSIAARFHVPGSQERVALELIHPRRQQFLEPREHTYLLFVLARERMNDGKIDDDRRGWRTMRWMEDALRIDAAGLNVLIHRARAQVASSGLEGAAGIVEVKRGARRFGTDRIEIVDDEGR